jgi:hypothetical protein
MSYSKTSYSKLARTLAVSLALAAAAVVTPQLAEPAHAGAVVSRFNPGDIIKIKTIWGGGYVLNFGESAGSHSPGVFAGVHWNSGWDNPNRFRVSDPWYESGMSWHMLVNRYSGLCMAALRLQNGAYVTQEPCDINSNTQWWSGEWWPGYSTVWIRNLEHYRAGRPTVLSQIHPQIVGTFAWLENLVNDGIRQEWEVHTCMFNGAEQKNC